MIGLILLLVGLILLRRAQRRIDALEKRVSLLESLGEGRYSWAKDRTPPSQPQ